MLTEVEAAMSVLGTCQEIAEKNMFDAQEHFAAESFDGDFTVA